jgi:hypothetical protein
MRTERSKQKFETKDDVEKKENITNQHYSRSRISFLSLSLGYLIRLRRLCSSMELVIVHRGHSGNVQYSRSKARFSIRDDKSNSRSVLIVAACKEEIGLNVHGMSTELSGTNKDEDP